MLKSCITCGTDFETGQSNAITCSEHRLTQKQKWARFYQKNKEREKARTNNRPVELKRRRSANWLKNHHAEHCAYQNLRRAHKLQATPKWLTKEQIESMKQFYRDCPKGYHVDHIHPLNGDGFSGLHVPWNLQYLPAKENLSKGNRLVE